MEKGTHSESKLQQKLVIVN